MVLITGQTRARCGTLSKPGAKSWLFTCGKVGITKEGKGQASMNPQGAVKAKAWDIYYERVQGRRNR